MAANKLRLALVQLAVGASKADNLQRAAGFVKEAAQKGAQLVALPECCNSPYGNAYFPEYAEVIPGESTDAFSKMAKENKIFLVAGSIPERSEAKVFNTCTVFNPEGDMVAKFRKMHLFDIDIPGKITFQESKTLTPGNEFVTFDTPYCKVGLGICYDIRFAEMAQIYAQKGCGLLLYPGAFNMTTGPAHWQLLCQARALDNQLHVAVVSPARDTSASYVAWGHSTLIDPWGAITAKADEKEQVIYGDVDIARLEEVRQNIPISHQKRHDRYKITDLSS